MLGFINNQSCFSIFFFFYYGFLGIVSPYLSLYFDLLGFTAFQISFLMSMLQLTRILGPFAWGYMADLRGDRIFIMRVTAVASFIFFIGIFYVQSFVQTIFWLFILNSVTSSLTPLGEAATISALKKDNTFEAKYGRLRLWGSVGFMAAVTLSGFWFEKYGIKTLPWVSLVCLGFVVISAWMLWEPKMEKHTMIPGQLREILFRKETLWFFSSAFWMVFAHASLYVFYSLYLQKLGFGKEVIGIFWMIGVGAEVIYFYFQKRFYDQFSSKRIIELTFILGMIRFLVIGYLPGFWTLLLAQILHAATFAAHHSASVQIVQNWFKGSTAVRGQALYTTIAYGLGGSIGGIVAGVVWTDIGPEHVFGLAFVSCVIGYVSILQSKRSARLAALHP